MVALSREPPESPGQLAETLMWSPSFSGPKYSVAYATHLSSPFHWPLNLISLTTAGMTPRITYKLRQIFGHNHRSAPLIVVGPVLGSRPRCGAGDALGLWEGQVTAKSPGLPTRSRRVGTQNMSLPFLYLHMFL